MPSNSRTQNSKSQTPSWSACLALLLIWVGARMCVKCGKTRLIKVVEQ